MKHSSLARIFSTAALGMILSVSLPWRAAAQFPTIDNSSWAASPANPNSALGQALYGDSGRPETPEQTAARIAAQAAWQQAHDKKMKGIMHDLQEAFANPVTTPEEVAKILQGESIGEFSADDAEYIKAVRLKLAANGAFVQDAPVTEEQALKMMKLMHELHGRDNVVNSVGMSILPIVFIGGAIACARAREAEAARFYHG